jgi:hypothetical protein
MMGTNPNLNFEHPVELLRAIGTSADGNGNEFQVIVTGPDEQVRKYIQSLPLHLEILPAAGLDEEQGQGGDQEESSLEPGEDRAFIEITEQELARSLFVKVELTVVRIRPPYLLHFTEDPGLAEAESRYYQFTDYVQAYVKCTSNSGNADLYLYERRCSSGACWWSWRRRSKNTTPVDECRAYERYTGTWLARVKAVTDCNFTLTGDLYVP